MVSYFPANDARIVQLLENEWAQIARSLGDAPALKKNPDSNVKPSDTI